jgi:hypothetical protein
MNDSVDRLVKLEMNNEEIISYLERRVRLLGIAIMILSFGVIVSTLHALLK